MRQITAVTMKLITIIDCHAISRVLVGQRFALLSTYRHTAGRFASNGRGRRHQVSARSIDFGSRKSGWQREIKDVSLQSRSVLAGQKLSDSKMIIYNLFCQCISDRHYKVCSLWVNASISKLIVSCISYGITWKIFAFASVVRALLTRTVLTRASLKHHIERTRQASKLLQRYSSLIPRYWKYEMKGYKLERDWDRETQQEEQVYSERRLIESKLTWPISHSIKCMKCTKYTLTREWKDEEED